MARRTKEEADQTRERILNAALDIIYEKGYARTTFVDIANNINLTKGAVYWHFKNKPDMFLALGGRMEKKIEVSLQSLYDRADSLIALKQALSETIHLITSDQQLRKYYTTVFYRLEWTDDILVLKDFFKAQEKEMLDYVAAILEKENRKLTTLKKKDVKSASRALLAFIDGLLGFCLANPEMEARERSRTVQVGLDTYFAGLQNSP